MPNSYFRFKQFTIHQDRCAMKVGTDGVLLGAWVDVAGARRILDVGTGTGLIALMLAQRSAARIEAIEIEQEAGRQARENVARSPWAERVIVHNRSLQEFAATGTKRYDRLVSNPPFFANSAKAPGLARKIARHTDTLTGLDLLQAAQTLLTDRGRLAVIYPVAAGQRLLEQAADFGLTLHRRLAVKPKAHLPVKRLALEFGRAHARRDPFPVSETLIIERAERHAYTAEFIGLIRDFYLKY